MDGTIMMRKTPAVFRRKRIENQTESLYHEVHELLETIKIV